MAFDGSGEAVVQQSRPIPQDVPYRPARSLTRRQRTDSEASIRERSIQSGNRDSKDLTDDVSPLDPRRFTPTLHANLVSEILALRRDLEAKHQMIDGLEATLNTTKQELEQTIETLNSTSKETRSLRRQMQLLEGGTSSALGELARERDEATEVTADLKKRLDTSQKKLRSKEEDNDRIHALWEKDRDNWDAERRKLDHKVHVVEGRLKSVLEEFAQRQAEQDAKDDGHVSETASIQSSPRRARLNRMSLISNDDISGVRYSMLSGPNGYGGAKLGGLTLAEELEAEDEMSEDDEHDEGAFTDAGADSTSSGHKHSQSLDSTDLNRPSSATDLEDIETKPEIHKGLPNIEEGPELAPQPFQYVDAEIQYTPPPSPKFQPVDAEVDALPPVETFDKEVQVVPPPIPSVIVTPVETASSECQTLDYPLSPPWTPTAKAIHSMPTPKPSLEMISIATQTAEEKKVPPPITIAPIPLIQIHPPTSAPSTPRSAVLPPLNKNVATQANIKSPVQLRSISMQTEEIKIDQRSIKLPPHLLPSSISSKPPTPEPETRTGKPVAELRSKKRRIARGVDPNTLSAKLKAAAGTQDAYPGNNDNGPLDEKNVNIKRPFRSSSLFAGFDVPSSDDAEDFNDTEMSDGDFKTALSARPRGKHRLSRVVSKPPRTVPEESGDSAASAKEKGKAVEANEDANEANGSSTPPPIARSSFEQLKEEPELPLPKSPERVVAASKSANIRKAALISSGTAAHIQRARSPSLGTATVSTTTSSRRVYLDPPFPVPKRNSSRAVPPPSFSDGTRSPTNGSFFSTHSRRSDYSRAMMRRDSLRKSRSAFALTRHYPERPRSRSPPPLTASTAAPESPHPPMPRDDITNHYTRERDMHNHDPLANSQAGAASIDSSMNQTNVVDSIAQTMIGEWMWKYVRRRKSFGVPDSPPPSAWGTQAVDESASSNGQRHKRWVWLAPYDRSIMWASRQPTTGSALMGKSGKKLVIQSVLDVKDDTPLKAGSQPAFNRSILILTPARALKFTAVSKERHLVWLTALSFLSHSPGGPGDILLPPLPFETPAVPHAAPPPQPAARQHRPIRDSIRIAKGKKKSFFTEESIREVESNDSITSSQREAAAAPTVPRFSSHSRKRSNTGPRVPPPLHPALTQNRSASHNTAVMPTSAGNANFSHSHNYQPSMYSTHTTTSSDLYYNITAPNPNNFYQDSYQGTRGSTSFSIRPSTDAQSTNSYALPSPNFFDAMGTMRMEAFVERSVRQPHYAEMEDPFSSSGPPSATTWGTRAGNRNSGASSNTGRWSRVLTSRAPNYNAPRGKTAPGGTGDAEGWGLSDDFFGVGERGMSSGRIVGVEDPFRGF